MKKKKVGGLLLRKNVISDLNTGKVTGGAQDSLTILVPIVIASAALCTRGQGCDMPTIGSGDGSNCLSTDGKGWCGGRG